MAEKKPEPLLACKTPEPLEKLQELGHFPMYGSYKLDGIRCLIRDGVAISRSFKPLPSAFIQERFALPQFEGMDGEVLAEEVDPGNTLYHATYSAAMTYGSTTPMRFAVFDSFAEPLTPYVDRLALVRLAIREQYRVKGLIVGVLEQRVLANIEQLLEMEKEALELGYEGLIVRTPLGQYKWGRSTLNQGWLVKIVRVLTAEAEIIGFQEMMRNANEAQLDAFDHTKRSSHKENLVGKGMLGAFLVRDLVTGVEFKIGTGEGLDMTLRQEIWDDRDSYLGLLAKYKYKPHGTKDRPRHPVWIGWRDKDDM